MRFERKYNIEGIHPKVIEQCIKNHPAGFSKIFPDRQVNNIYFDTPNLTTYRDNVIGINQRKKIRLRWYGKDLEKISSPKLELKEKHNELGTKKIADFADTTLLQLSEINVKTNAFFHNLMPLQPVLLNSYERSYWGSADGVFRITIDQKLQYHSLLLGGHFQQFSHSDTASVLEIKYEQEDEDKADFIFQHLPFRQTRNSKYVRGMVMTNGF